MSAIKNGQISLYCHFNKIIKGPGTSFQSFFLETEKSLILHIVNQNHCSNYLPSKHGVISFLCSLRPDHKFCCIYGVNPVILIPTNYISNPNTKELCVKSIKNFLVIPSNFGTGALTNLYNTSIIKTNKKLYDNEFFFAKYILGERVQFLYVFY